VRERERERKKEMERTGVCMNMIVYDRVFTHKAHTNTRMKKDTATTHCNKTSVHVCPK